MTFRLDYRPLEARTLASGSRVGQFMPSGGSMSDLVALIDAHDEAQPRQKPGRKPKAVGAPARE
jgi:hypothetical protein